jgi:hypothetical protein
VCVCVCARARAHVHLCVLRGGGGLIRVEVGEAVVKGWRPTMSYEEEDTCMSYEEEDTSR